MERFKYDYRKFVLFLIFSLVLGIFFGWLFVDSENQFFNVIKSTYSNRYGRLLFRNELILRIFTSASFFLFLFFSIHLIKLIIKKFVIFEVRSGFLYKDNRRIVKISDINYLKINKNNFINIFLVNPHEIINHEPNFLKKLTYKISNYTEKTPISININS